MTQGSPMRDTAHPERKPPAWPRALAWLAVAVGLAVVFMAYASPGLMMELANQVWACF